MIDGRMPGPWACWVPTQVSPILMVAPRFLITRFSAIGDCVMTSWAVTSIKLAYPGAEITWLVEARCAPIAYASVATKVIPIPRDRWKQNRGSALTWRDQLAFYVKLRREKYDIGLDFQGHSKTALALRIAAPKVRMSARATDALARTLNPMITSVQGEHTVDRNLRLLNSVGQFENVATPTLNIAAPPADFPVKPVVTISTGAGQPEKAVPADHWQEVGQQFLNRNWNVVFLGGPTDPQISLPGSTNWVDALALGDTLATVAGSDLHLAADTGTGHMAAATGVPVVSVFGPTDPAEFRPFTPTGVVLHRGSSTALVDPSEIVSRGLELVRRSYAQIPH